MESGKEPLISIITPCYNGEKYLASFFRGILGQKHKALELIFVDDGSTDNSAAVAKSYEDELSSSGMDFVYIYQDNSGVAAAINKGLAVFKGDYLTWVDSDDIMMSENISKKLEYLEAHPECGFAMSGIQVVGENNPEKIISYRMRKKPDGKDTIFEDYVLGRNVVWVPGTVLVRRECILEAIPTREIYESREGQNWQLMLPITWKYRCGYIDEPLLTCVQHKDSHSRMERTEKEKIQREKNFITLCCETVQSIPDMSENEKIHWCDVIKVTHNRNIMKIAANELDYSAYSAARKEIKLLGGAITAGDSFAVLISKKGIRKEKLLIRKIIGRNIG